MNQQEMDRLIDSLLIYMPMFYKKLTSSKETDIKKSGYKKRTADQYQILGLLEHYKYLSISEIGKKLLLSRPNMTAHLDKLVSEGLVQRIPDDTDRRVINIGITQEGLDYIKESRTWVNNNIRDTLKVLNNEELVKMYSCIETIKSKILMIEEDHHDRINKRI
jgi:DNA-binding MarR family transcriptional regulator